MSIRPNPADTSTPAKPLRSTESRAFEAMWRGLRRGALIPARSDFDPRSAIPFLKNIVLVDVPQFDGDSVRVRLVGTGFERRIQNNITGLNYLDHLPEAFHADALESIRLLFSQPCGLWQVMTMHYERMFAEPLEVTVFPLDRDGDKPPLLLTHVKPIGKPAVPTPTDGKAMRADTASHFAFIDIGAGEPSWPQRNSA